MNMNMINETARKTLAGEISSGSRQPIINGVEYYHVDYIGMQTFTVRMVIWWFTPINWEGIAAGGILSSQWMQCGRTSSTAKVNGQRVPRLYASRHGSGRAGLFWHFLRGKRVTYFGRQGDEHTEWFPGARP